MQTASVYSNQPITMAHLSTVSPAQFDIGEFLYQARSAAGLGLREVARRAGTSHATVRAYEQNKKVPSVATFLKILSACRYAVDISLEPRIRDRRGMQRGDELAQVLELAEQFPSKPLKKMPFPRFGKPA